MSLKKWLKEAIFLKETGKTLKFRLILETENSVGPLSTTARPTKTFFKFITVALVLPCFLVYPKNTDAAFLGFGNKVSAATDGSVSSNQDYSQSMTGLLVAALNSDPANTTTATATIEDEEALSAPVSPLQISDSAHKVTKDQVATYVVEDGDTLSSIAKKYGVSVNTIRWANDIGSKGVIKPGQELIILPVSGVTHTVKKGETISAIAKKYSADVDEILNFNIIEADEIKVGQELIIPGGEPQPTPSSRTPTIVGSLARSSSGRYIAPLRGVVTQGIHGRNAVDIAAPVGTPIYSACDGSVTIAKGFGNNGGYGIYSVVTCDDGVQMLYAHMSRLAVSPGDVLVKGDNIGYVGSTGRSTGPHLHFEVRGGSRNFMAP